MARRRDFYWFEHCIRVGLLGKAFYLFLAVQWSEFGFVAWARLRRLMCEGLFAREPGNRSSESVSWAILFLSCCLITGLALLVKASHGYPSTEVYTVSKHIDYYSSVGPPNRVRESPSPHRAEVVHIAPILYPGVTERSTALPEPNSTD
jgi:hypothetical protein